MRNHRRISLIALLLGVLVFTASAMAQERPNFVFFFTDDQSLDSIGCYGNPNVKTPHMDRLGAKGVIFDRHYDSTAICMASRANVMVGMYEFKTGTNFMHGPMSREIWRKSYPALLREAGYRTGFGGKFGFAVVDDPREGGSENTYDNLPMADFDFWVGGTGQTSYITAQNKYLAPYADRYPHSSRAYGAAGQDFVRESVAAKQPFCLTLFFKAPHRPTTPDPMFDDVYKDTVFRKPPNYGREAGEHLAPQSRMGRQYPRFETWGYHTEESYQQAMRTYHQQIYGVDYAMGMVMEELERQGVADNTVVIFSSDNGFFNGSHGLGSKELLYEESARVPLIVYDPRHAEAGQGRRIGALSGNVDIAATIVELAGLPLPGAMDGVSLAPLVQGKAPRVRDTLTLVQAWGTVGTLKLGVVTETHKYLFWCYGEGMPPAEELFDLANDPYEMKNLAELPEHARVLEEMRTRYDAALAQWKAESVPYNDYPVFGTLYDRHLSWEAKRDLVPKQFLSATADE